MRSALGFVVLVAACHAAPAPVEIAPATLPQAATYEVRLHRPGKVGQREHAVIDESTENTNRGLGGYEDDRHGSTKFHFDATSTIVAVGERDALRIDYVVRSFRRTTEKGAEVLLHDGQRIQLTRAAKSEDAAVMVDGQPAPADLRKALGEVLTFGSGGKTDDEIFGTRQRQTVGSVWPMDTAAAMDDLFDHDVDGTAGGEVTLVSLAKIGAVDALEVRARFRLDGIRALPGLEENTVVESGQISATLRGMYPVDPQLPRLSDEMELAMTVRIRVHGEGGDVRVETTSITRHTGTYTPL